MTASTTPDDRSVGVGWSRRLSLIAIGADPGLNRLRAGTAAAVCVSVALAVEFALARVLGLGQMPTIVFMMMGGIVGMLGANALVRTEVRATLRAAVFFPIALGAGLGAGSLVGTHRVLGLAGFVVVMFAAVYIRRFGLDYFFAGFLVWIGYFFADFLKVEPADLPGMMLAVVVATLTVAVLCITVFRPHPRRTLRRIFRSMDARSRRAAAHSVRVISSARGTPERERALRRLRLARRRVREAALMGDGWAAVSPALPPGWSAVGVRRRLLERQLQLERLAAASDEFSSEDVAVQAAILDPLRRYAGGVGRGDVAQALERLRGQMRRYPDEARSAAERICSSLDALTRAPVAGEAPSGLEEFEPATTLMLGNLPGSASVAKEVTARGRLRPLVRLRLTTRQAVQVAIAGSLAIVIGSLVSPQRYYWAVIAAFVAFTGTGSRLETFRKSLNRVLGTLFGLFAGILLAGMTDGHPQWALVIVIVSIFCGFSLVRVSYSYMIFFITIMLSQLYSILGMFSDGLLVLRLEETAIGAAIGIAVALLVTPVSTRDTVAHASGALLAAIADVLEKAAEARRLPGSVGEATLDGLMFAVDDGMRRLDLVSDPLTRQFLWERRPREVRHRIALFSACVYSTRELVTAASHAAEGAPPADAWAAEYDRLAVLARRASGQPPDEDEQGDASAPPAAGGDTGDGPVARHTARLRELIAELERS